MISALVFVLAQGLVVDGTRYHVADDGRLQATRVADGHPWYRWWPDPPATPVRARLSWGTVAFEQRPRRVLAAGIGSTPGVFALDITEPERGEAVQLRVFMEEGIVGAVTESLVVARLGPQAQPFVLGSTGLGAHKPGLLLLPLDKEGHFVLEVHSPGATLGGVAVARHTDGRALYAYAGDSAGRLWRFDLNGDAPWSQPKLRKPVFTATRADGLPQPITLAPAVMFGPGKGYLVAFGTSGDKGNTLYAVHDRLGKPQNLGRDKLVRRKAVKEGDGLRIDGRAVDYDEDAGWYLDLACGAGERMAGLEAHGGILVASTSIASDDAEGAGCSYALASLTGLPPDKAITGKRVDRADGIAELVAIGPADTLASTPHSATRVQSYQLVRRDLDGKVHQLQDIRIKRKYGRLTWRELPHWRALHKKSKESP